MKLVQHINIHRVACFWLVSVLLLGGVALYQSVQAQRRAELAWAWQDQARQLQQKKQWSAAEDAWKRALFYEAPESRGHVYLALADLHQRQNKLPLALKEYQWALPYELGREQRADANLQIGDILAKSGAKTEAVAHWREAASLTPLGMALQASGYSTHKEAEARLKGAGSAQH